jgi:structural maintenance of chromosome 4
VIDAMMFVFGKRAKQLRLNKVSELIHNSTDFRNLEHARVEVHFHEIIDHVDDEEGYDIVPNSDFVISREAYRNNSSKYFVNDKTSSFTEVTKLLKSKDVDLNNNRFLILQGEVEQISMMKPKGAAPGDEGLLEYLEDIIGTLQYVEPIEEASKKLEELNEQRDVMVNRLKLVEGEKDALAIVKAEAEAFLEKEKELLSTRSTMYQLFIKETQTNLVKIQENKDALTQKLEEERAKHSEHEDALKAAEGRKGEIANELSKIQADFDKSVKDFADFELKDAKYREELKNMKASVKKLNTKIATDTEKQQKMAAECAAIEKEVPVLEAKKADLEARIDKEEAALDALVASLQDEFAAVGRELDQAQKDLAPWEGKLAAAQGAFNVATSERALLLEKHADAEKSLNAAREGQKEARVKAIELKKTIGEEEATLETERARADKARVMEADAKEKEAAAQAETREIRGKLEQRRSTAETEKSQNAMVQALLDAQAAGALKGVLGRLGDLGAIDKEYDVAVSTACGPLDHILVETTSDAQLCVSYLRKHNLGRGNFLALDRQKHLLSKMNEKVSNPDNAPRLIDLIKPAEERFAVAFYFGVRDTLVAQDLEQASRLAHGEKRRRVVTIQGQLFETSGTLSGGGSKPRTGRMRVGNQAPVITDAAEVAKEIKMAEVELEQAGKLYERSRQVALKSLQEARDAEAIVNKIERMIPKLKAEFDAAEAKAADLSTRLVELEAAHDASKNDADELKRLDKEVEKAKVVLDEVTAGAAALKQKEAELQEKMDNVGGDGLKRQRALVKDLTAGIAAASDAVTEKRAKAKSHEGTTARLSKGIEANQAEVEQIKANMQNHEAEFKALEDGAAAVLESQGELKQLLEVKSGEFSEAQKAFDEIMKIVGTIRGVEVDIQAKLDDLSVVQKENKDKEKHWNKEINKVTKERTSLYAEGEVPELLNDEELEQHTTDEMQEKAVILEEELAAAKPDMSSIEAYAKKAEEYEERAAELSAATEERDNTREAYDKLRQKRLNEFMDGFNIISLKLKEMYQMITLGGDAELELVDSLDPFSEGIVFSVRPPKKSWKNIANLSGGEKTLSSLALVFALHHYKPTPLYVMDEIDAALDFKNVSIVGHYIKERTKNAQFVIISLRNNMFELADRLVGIYKTNNTTKTVAINPGAFKVGANQLAQLQQQESNAAVEAERAALTA